MQITKNWIVVGSGLLTITFASMLVVEKAHAQSTLEPQRTRQGGVGTLREIPNPSLGVQPVIYGDSYVDHVIDDDIYLFVVHGNVITKVDKRSMEILGNTELPMTGSRFGTRPPLPGTPGAPARRDGDGDE